MNAKTMLVIILGISFLTAVPAMAVDFQFGLKGGVNRAQTDLEDPPSDQDRSAIAAPIGGAVLSFGFGGAIGVDADVLYVRKGVHTRHETFHEGYSQGEEADLHLDYLVISPLLKIGGGGQSFSPYFLGGIELGILLKANSQATTWNGLPRTTWNNEYDMKEFMESTALAWSVGAGLEIPTSSVSLLVETRYVQGISNIWTEDNTGAGGEETPKGLYFLGGVRF